MLQQARKAGQAADLHATLSTDQPDKHMLSCLLLSAESENTVTQMITPELPHLDNTD